MEFFKSKKLANPKLHFLKFAIIFGSIGLLFYRIQRYSGRVSDTAFPGAELFKLTLGIAMTCIPFALIFAAAYWVLESIKKPTSTVVNYWHWTVFLIYYALGVLYGALILVYDIEGPLAAITAVLAGVSGLLLYLGLIANIAYAFSAKLQEKYPNDQLEQ